MTHNVTYYDLYKLDAISNFSEYTILQNNRSFTMYSVLRCKCDLCSYCKQ